MDFSSYILNQMLKIKIDTCIKFAGTIKSKKENIDIIH